MQKPTGYDEARESGEFIPVTVGGHYAVVKQVTETQSSTGKDMIVVLFDFCKPDKQEGYHTAAFEADTRDERKWPFNGSKYIMVQDYNDPNKTSRPFKTFCSCVEKSNNCTIKWGGSDWGKQFKGKKIGVVYGQEENEYEGKITMRSTPRWFCAWDAVERAGIPEPKYLPGHSAPAAANAATTTKTDGFMNIPDEVSDEGIPF